MDRRIWENLTVRLPSKTIYLHGADLEDMEGEEPSNLSSKKPYPSSLIEEAIITTQLIAKQYSRKLTRDERDPPATKESSFPN